MAHKKSASDRRVDIKVGDISGASGNLNIAGGNITNQHVTVGMSAAEINGLFDRIYAAIEARPDSSPAKRNDLKAEVQELQGAVTAATDKNEPLDQGFWARHFRNIARMAPDILDVVVGTLANPLAGLGIAARKIAARAKEEAASS